jgi:hypothetical protein
MMKHLSTKNLFGGPGPLVHTIIGHTGLVGGQVEVMADMDTTEAGAEDILIIGEAQDPGVEVAEAALVGHQEEVDLAAAEGALVEEEEVAAAAAVAGEVEAAVVVKNIYY